MISIDQQQKMLLNISRRLKKKVVAYAVGGTAMMFLGFKDATLDIDLVFATEEERELFKNAAKSLGFQETDTTKVYSVKRNTPLMLNLNDQRFDLFVANVIDFIFSEDMRKRADQTHQFGDNLILKIANPHDIVLMKCATDRLKDKDDARKIINSTRINWETVITETKNQIALGKEMAAFELGEFLEYIKTKMKVDIPQQVLDKLFSIVEGQAKNKRSKHSR